MHYRTPAPFRADLFGALSKHVQLHDCNQGSLCISVASHTCRPSPFRTGVSEAFAILLSMAARGQGRMQKALKYIIKCYGAIVALSTNPTAIR